MNISGGPPLTKVQMCELEAFVAASRLYAKFDCPMARQNCSLLATAHDCETGLFSHFPNACHSTCFWFTSLKAGVTNDLLLLVMCPSV